MFTMPKKKWTPSPYSGRKSLFLRVARAEDLIRADVFGGSDPYAKVFWNGLFAGKTKVKQDTLNPVWDRETSVFEIPLVPGEPDIEHSTLKIELFDHDTIGSHDSLGELHVDGYEMNALIENSKIRKFEKSKFKKRAKQIVASLRFSQALEVSPPTYVGPMSESSPLSETPGQMVMDRTTWNL